MASLSDTIDLIFKGKDEVSRAIGTVGDGLDTLGKSVGRVTGPLANVTTLLGGMEAGMAALAAVIVVKAVDAATQFQSALYAVDKQLGASGGVTEGQITLIQNLALKYAQSANDVARSIGGFLAAGYDVKTAGGLVEAGMSLMLAGEMSAVDATESIKFALAGFNVPASNAADAGQRIGDILNRIADISGTNIGEMSTAFSRLAPTARDAGMSMETTASVAAVLVRNLGSGEQAATALKSGLLSLLAPSGDAKEKLSELGVKIEDSNGKLRSAADILADLAGKWSGMGDSVRLQASAVLFGKDQAGAMNTVLGQWNSALDYNNQLLDKNTGAVGSMAREVEGKLKLVDQQCARTKEAWQQVLTEFGRKLLVDTSGAVTSLGELGTAVRDEVKKGSFNELLDIFKDVFKMMDETISAMAKNLPDALKGVSFDELGSSIRESLRLIGDFWDSLTDGADLTTVDGLKRAIQAVIDGVAVAIRAFNAWYGTINQVFENFKNSTMGGYILSFFDTIPQGARKANEGTAAAAKDGATIYKEYFDFLQGIHATADDAVAGVEAAFANMTLTVPDTGPWKSSITDLEDVRFSLASPELDLGPVQRSAGEIKDIVSDTIYKLNQSDPIEININTEKSKQELDEFRREWDKKLRPGMAGDGIGYNVKLTLDKDGQALPELSTQLGDLGIKVDGVNTKLFDTGEKIKVVKTVGKDGKVTYRNLEQQFGKTGDAAKEMGDTLKLKTTKDILEATKIANDFQIKMEEIASNERIKNIEAAVSIKVAGLQADAERVKSIFASIDNTVSSTGDLLGSLFGQLGQATGFDKYAINDQIELENERRQVALDLQKRMVEKEIERIQAQINSLNRGDALITIEGSGLKPELEAFMWKILSLIRVRANAEFSQYLLGVASP